MVPFLLNYFSNAHYESSEVDLLVITRYSLLCIPKQLLEKHTARREVFSEHLRGTPGWSYGPESDHKR